MRYLTQRRAYFRGALSLQTDRPSPSNGGSLNLERGFNLDRDWRASKGICHLHMQVHIGLLGESFVEIVITFLLTLLCHELAKGLKVAAFRMKCIISLSGIPCYPRWLECIVY